MKKCFMNDNQSQTTQSQANQAKRIPQSKLGKLFFYTIDGTLYDRFCLWHLKRQIARRVKLWEKLATTKQIVEHKLETGAKLCLYHDDQLSRDLFSYRFEADERDFVRRYLRAGDLFIDVGANIGLFTLIGAGAVGPQGKVYALEPTSVTYGRLVHNVNHNRFHNVECVQAALSDKDEERLMTTSIDGFYAWNSLGRPTAGGRFAEEAIRCYKWDTFADHHGLTGRVALMKIDIEGWEYYMLQGAQATLQRADAPDLLVEFTEVNARAAGVSGAAVYDLLLTLGYQLYRIAPNQKRLYPAIPKEYEFENLVATKNLTQLCVRTGYRYENR